MDSGWYVAAALYLTGASLCWHFIIVSAMAMGTRPPHRAAIATAAMLWPLFTVHAMWSTRHG